MTTKDYLNQISYYNKIIDNKLIEITQYKELSYSISAVVNEERVMSSSDPDKTGCGYVKLEQMEEKIERYRSLGMREKIRLKTGYELFVRVHGATVEEARILLNKFTLDGRVPEPVRLARMAARAARKVEEGLASGSE